MEFNQTIPDFLCFDSSFDLVFPQSGALGRIAMRPYTAKQHGAFIPLDKGINRLDY